jgi:uracil-DNA glycosylase family protein
VANGVVTATGPPVSSLLPPEPTIDGLREAAAGCQACELWQLGTQTVFGEGPTRARVLFVGEQPGDQEDRQGHPFVGPAGRVLDEALVAAGIPRDDVYVTNAVKHFRWEARGKRRIHKKPSVEHVDACRPWLEAEIAAVRPEVVVCLGATAAQALLGRTFRVSRQRGELVRREDGTVVTATVHPSSILRSQETRAQEMEAFVADLRAVAQLLEAPG